MGMPEVLFFSFLFVFRVISWTKVPFVIIQIGLSDMASCICFLRYISRIVVFTCLVLSLLVTVVTDRSWAVLPVHALMAGGNSAAVSTSTDAEESPSPAQEQQTGIVSGHSIGDLQVLLEGFINVLYWRFDILLTANSAKVPYDVAQDMDRLSLGKGTGGFVRMLGLLGIVFSLIPSSCPFTAPGGDTGR